MTTKDTFIEIVTMSYESNPLIFYLFIIQILIYVFEAKFFSDGSCQTGKVDSWFMPKQEHRAIEILPIAVGSVSWAAPLDSRVTLHCETEGITPALSLL